MKSNREGDHLSGEEEGEEEKKEEGVKDFSHFSEVSASAPSSISSSASSQPSSLVTGGGGDSGGMCTGDVCSFDPSRFDSGGPAVDSGPSNFFGSGQSTSAPAATQPTSSFSPPSGGGGCDGDVCSFDPPRFDSPSPSATSPPATEGATNNPWNQFQKQPDTDPVQDCVNDVCTQVVTEQVTKSDDCEGGELGGTCERTESFNIRFSRVVETAKQSILSQLLILHFSFLSSLNRQVAEHLVYIDERFTSTKQFLRDIIYKTISSTLFLIFVKLMYDVFVETMVQFCCGGPVKEVIPRLDRIMSGVTIFTAMRNCQSEGKLFCFCRGVKDVCKTLLIVYLSSTIVGAFLSTFSVHLTERIFIFVYQKVLKKKSKEE